ncbi:MAG: ATP-binding cassette domain-containing protein, partial [Halomonas sp.]|uniref:ABC transporter ATP-binding protein n=1 Tax=Halomonas sp. TaxID=1486246 RepID=UPI00286FB52B
YEPDKPILSDFTLKINPGETIALVGPTGGGKTTIVNLICRFYEPKRGAIRIGGRDYRDLSLHAIQSRVGVVLQTPHLFSGTIRDNIRYGSIDASEEAIWEAVRRAHADTFLDDLVDLQGRRGLDAHVGERGVKLSGGQRQRIAIARVLLKNAPILVLDEATSALDSEVEAAIQEQLYALMEGKTVIAIAHRLSTIAMLDRLVVIDEGGIVESGSHRELLARDGLYAALWRRQSGGFIGEDIEDEAETA